ncbi:MAG TPA: hypothetical protein VIJ77_08565, partial [Candidatus Tumulicola sp.]
MIDDRLRIPARSGQVECQLRSVGTRCTPSGHRHVRQFGNPLTNVVAVGIVAMALPFGVVNPRILGHVGPGGCDPLPVSR